MTLSNSSSYITSRMRSCAVTVNFFVMTFETFITGRTAERALWSLRVKVFSHLHRQGLDYYQLSTAEPLDGALREFLRRRQATSF